MEVKLDQKLNEYKEYIDTLKQIDSLEVYNWLMGLGSKLNENPLSESKHLPENKVTKCQYDLYVDREDEKFKAWSKAMVAGGYAYILVDIFNSLSLEDAKKVTVDDFKKMKLDEMLTMNRQTGFYQMVEMMIKKLNNI
jgi:sulfur transfer protein SufE